MANNIEFFRDMYERAPVGYFSVGADGKVIECNGHSAAMLGYSRDELIGRPVFSLYTDTEDGKEKAYQVFSQFKNGRPITGEILSMRNKRGDIVWINLSVNALRDSQGQIVQSRSIAVDITERICLEEELRQEHEFSESIIETAQAIIVVLDTEGRIVRYNPYMESISGYCLEEGAGQDWFATFLPGDDHDTIRALFKQAIGEIRTQGNVNPIIAKNGQEHIIEWYDKTLKDQDGHVVGLVAVGHDITDKKKLEAELSAHREHLEELVAERTSSLQILVNAMAGREVRMAGLKKVIQQLRTQIQAAGMQPVANDPLLENGPN